MLPLILSMDEKLKNRKNKDTGSAASCNRYIFHHYIIMVVRGPQAGGFVWEALSAEKMKVGVQHGQPVSQSV